MDALTSFLRSDAERSLSYGQYDCLLRLAEWGRTICGRDAGTPWRGRYRTELGAARVLQREGGMVAVVGRAFEAIGWQRTTSPRRGAVAVAEGDLGETGAIVLSNELVAAARFDGVIQLRRWPIIAAWQWAG